MPMTLTFISFFIMVSHEIEINRDPRIVSVQIFSLNS